MGAPPAVEPHKGATSAPDPLRSPLPHPHTQHVAGLPIAVRGAAPTRNAGARDVDALSATPAPFFPPARTVRRVFPPAARPAHTQLLTRSSTTDTFRTSPRAALCVPLVPPPRRGRTPVRAVIGTP